MKEAVGPRDWVFAGGRLVHLWELASPWRASLPASPPPPDVRPPIAGGGLATSLSKGGRARLRGKAAGLTPRLSLLDWTEKNVCLRGSKVSLFLNRGYRSSSEFCAEAVLQVCAFRILLFRKDARERGGGAGGLSLAPAFGRRDLQHGTPSPGTRPLVVLPFTGCAAPSTELGARALLLLK